MSESRHRKTGRAPFLARLCALAGPARAGVFDSDGARVAVVPGRYSVSYVLDGPDGVAIVDAGSVQDGPQIETALRRLGRAPSDVRYVVPSHLHFDHVMGIDRLARDLDAAVLLGETAHRLVTAGRPLAFPRRLRNWRALVTWPMQGLPVFTRDDLREGLDFGFPWSRHRFRARLAPPLRDGSELPGLTGWRLLETPGHAPDAVALHHGRARFLVTGDTVRNFYGGEWNPLLVDREAFARSRRRLRALAVDTVFPGHGPVLRGPDVLDRVQVLPAGIP